jgi:hypothetical protein
VPRRKRVTGEVLYGINEWVLFILTVGALYGAAEIGFRYGIRYTERTRPEIHSHVATVEGALLGLLALLLGFAFAMSMSRFETRRQVVLEEINDLGTTYLRAHLLPERHRAKCIGLLQEYVQSRIDFLQAGTDAVRSREIESSTLRLQVRLWAAAVAEAREDSNEVTTGYFIESLNKLIDDHTKRSNAMENHVPEIILHLLMLVATLTIAVTGYSSGLRGKRLKALRVILVFLIAATLIVIIDLDRPRRGLIRVSEGGMVRLQSEMGEFHRGVSAP